MSKNFWVVQYDFDNKWGVKCKADQDMTDILIANTHVVYETEFDARIDAVICNLLYNEQRISEINCKLNSIK